MGPLANCEDPDAMQHNAAFHQGLHILVRLKQTSRIEKHCNLENSTFDPLMFIMGTPMLIVSICMGKSIRIQSVNIVFKPICFVLCFACLFKASI